MNDTTHPTPIAPFLSSCLCISANRCLGKGHPPSFLTSFSVIFKIVKYPDGSGVSTKVSKVFNFNISSALYWNNKGITNIANKGIIKSFV